MQLIKKIEINYMRSIHSLRLDTIGNLTIFSGKNDVGKSNILKALNLFFKNQIDWEESFNFSQDFSLRRLNEVRSESIKGRQFIWIAITFQRPSNYKGSLPDTFRVKKSWRRDGSVQESDDLETKNKNANLPSTLDIARRMLSQFLNRIHFEYIPAIRHKKYFEYVIGNLQDSLLGTQLKSDSIRDAITELNMTFSERADSIKKAFGKATKIEADISLPVDLKSLLQAFSVSTKWSSNIEETISLSLRGDGIQALYIPTLLNYISHNSKKFNIWCFEEPENSVEYNYAIELAKRFETIYSKNAQIFVTSHSPAFVSLKGEKTVAYRVYKEKKATKVTELHPNPDENTLEQLREDIGLYRIQEELHQEYIRQRKELESVQTEVQRLKTELEQTTKPVVYVEGKWDEKILKIAWKKLNKGQMSFKIKGCDPLPSNNKGGAGGAGTLNKLLSTIQADNLHYVIGIFDRDTEGIKEFDKLPNFNQLASIDGVKKCKNNKVAAFLLPIPESKEKYADYDNLVIEFYFSENALSKRTKNGYSLKFRFPELETKAKSHAAPVIKREVTNQLELREIINGKKVFAEKIVPTLGQDEFENFNLIFDKIEEILKSLEDEQLSI
jgi:hypothetical protein